MRERSPSYSSYVLVLKSARPRSERPHRSSAPFRPCPSHAASPARDNLTGASFPTSAKNYSAFKYPKCRKRRKKQRQVVRPAVLQLSRASFSLSRARILWDTCRNMDFFACSTYSPLAGISFSFGFVIIYVCSACAAFRSCSMSLRLTTCLPRRGSSLQRLAVIYAGTAQLYQLCD